MELDRLLEIMASKGSPQAHLVSGQALYIWSDSGWQQSGIPLAPGRLNRMLSLAAPSDVRSVIHDQNARYYFEALGPAGRYRVNVEAIAGQRSVFVTLLDGYGAPLRPVDTTDTVIAPLFEDDEDDEWVQAAAINEWFYAHAGHTMGPHSFEQMASLLKSGALPGETPVFDSRVGDWQPAKFSDLGRLYPPEKKTEWVSPSVSDWQPPTKIEIQAEKILVGTLSMGGIAVVLALIGWITIAQVRGSNRAFDYSTQAITAAEQLSIGTPSGAIHNIRLQRSDAEPDVYSGKAQYSNNYLADVRIEADKRDFWSKPTDWRLVVQPHDFSTELEPLVQDRMNQQYIATGNNFRIDDVSLFHGDHNLYSGSCHWDDDTTGAVYTEITAFNSDGEISEWKLTVDPN
ncbi:DUF4339 domain-containing protein [bacterium]|nr:MAG: DUF4339 domain-containing protein [bacterium]